MDAELSVQSVVWVLGAEQYAVLFCEDPAGLTIRQTGGDETSVLLTTVIECGLPLITNIPELELDMARDWHARLDTSDRLTIDWPAPHGRPLLMAMPLRHPPGWLDAARKHGVVVLFCGIDFGLDGATDPTDRLPEVAAGGGLAAGTVAFDAA